MASLQCGEEGIFTL
jgi:hypothetical protein